MQILAYNISHCRTWQQYFNYNWLAVSGRR